ncbi:hypothetical protein Bhyg_02296, partial [Pseudolycoriella hygida]
DSRAMPDVQQSNNSTYVTNNHQSIQPSSSTPNSLMTSSHQHSTATDEAKLNLYQSQHEIVRSIQLPVKVNPVGRPKGSKTTVIGTKRKENNRAAVIAKRLCDNSFTNQAKIRFIQMPDDDQALTLLQWLTKMEKSEIIQGRPREYIHDSARIGTRISIAGLNYVKPQYFDIRNA